ncbi:MAG: thioredoxin domain-containing protein [Deltaproteobacteria bacterium]|nr:thioredoxin domain-containing protein [Deltaproteobacteria bacterium]
MKKTLLILGVIGCAALISLGILFEGVGRAVFKLFSSNLYFFSHEAILPGANQFNGRLLYSFSVKQTERAKNYKPRTRHLNKDGWARYTNRLFLESSPYLLQHAHNPVNWYSWGDEAFKTAKKLNRPVLLSVGYSTCHWCHVMEEESFEDEEVAKILNENYVAVKVDREERPDIDAIYMNALQVLTGSGGWPMTVWLTPEHKPFYAATYIPARHGDRGVSVGFLTLLRKLRQIHDDEPEKIKNAGSQLTDAIQDSMHPGAQSDLPKIEILYRAAKYYKDNFDETNGGMSGAPKFPSSFPVRFLLRYYKKTGDHKVLNAITLTLKKMAAGGMYDQIGGGFHRYSTDAQWLVPHFEKMLYDNALLALAYLESYQLTQNDEFRQVAEDILHYIRQDMTSPQGVFYSATDADSVTPEGHREEGYYFTWTPKDLKGALSRDELSLITPYYDVIENGNFEGRSIFNTPVPLLRIAHQLKMSETVTRHKIKNIRDKLYQVRLKRQSPLKDEKILTAWNALMISAYARAGFILDKKEYIQIAEKATRFIFKNLYKNKILHRSFKDGAPKYKAYLDDYAFLIASLLDLYEATFEPGWLTKAFELDKTLQESFEDDAGGFFMTSTEHEKLIAREKSTYDGALPSGNSVALLNLLRLYELTTDYSYYKRAEKLLKSFSTRLSQSPVSLSEMLLAIDFYFDQPQEIVIIAPKGKPSEVEKFLAPLRKNFLPNKILVVAEDGGNIQKNQKLIPLIESKYAINSQTTAYVCKKGVCELPTNKIEVFMRQLKIAPSSGLP